MYKTLLARDLGPEHIGKDLVYQKHFKEIRAIRYVHIYTVVKLKNGPQDFYEVYLRPDQEVGVTE